MYILEFKANNQKNKKVEIKKHKYTLTKSLKPHTSKQSTHQLTPFAGTQILLP